MNQSSTDSNAAAKSSASPALQAAWATYHASVEEARAMIEATPRFKTNPETRAQGYYALAEAQAMAYNFAIAPRVNYPMVNTHTSWFTYFSTLGGNGADFVYGTLFVDGKQTYRLTGNKGDLKLLLMQVHNYVIGHPESRLIGNYDFEDFEVKADGSFEVILSATKHEGNWIALEPTSDYNYFMIRRVVADWHDNKGTLEVTPLTKLEGYDEFSEAALAKRLHLAAGALKNFFIKALGIGFYDLCVEQSKGVEHQFAALDGATLGSKYSGSPSSRYACATFDIQPGDAVIIELEVPDAHYWQFQLYDVWCKSLDFVNFQTDINMHHAVLDADGKCRVVLSLEDPGVANWLDPVGRKQGFIAFRNYRTKTAPTPSAKLVKLAELRQHLPPETRMVTPQQRQAALVHRRSGLVKLYG